MTRDDTKKLLLAITTMYPNYKADNKALMVDLWSEMLREYDYNTIMQGLKAYITTDTSGFAPSIGKLIQMCNDLNKPRAVSDLEAWSLVYKAICNSNYNAIDEYNKLPPQVQTAVGDVGNLKQWAMLDTRSVKSVIQSQFLRSYRDVVQTEKEKMRLPESMQERYKVLQDTTIKQLNAL